MIFFVDGRMMQAAGERTRIPLPPPSGYDKLNKICMIGLQGIIRSFPNQFAHISFM
jgi:hypothetical protein